MLLTSTAFQDNAFIPSLYTCTGKNINPPLTFSQVPMQAKSLVLFVEDPDAPGTTWTHWVVYNIPPSMPILSENSVPEGALLAKNDFGTVSYGGPCPPSGTHRYFFTLFALDNVLDLPAGVSRQEVKDAMEQHIIDSTQLVGLYKKP